MWHLLERLGDRVWRARLGARIEALTDEVFQVLRWVLMVAFARYLSLSHPGWLLDALYWGLAALLFGYLAARLLLRPELPLFAPDRRWKRLAQSAANLLLCVGIFTALLWGVEAVTGAVVSDRLTAIR
ncbi:MAG: hypothetical protein CVT80_09995 [Alphaproteobacteria bacterium HGW-Alphaproteobacteria-2]|nr:MAG: hypothetical protein CVT80_09995 [Alphaproteobacteria bacterium HGW-Alphaproteobacteria-2]